MEIGDKDDFNHGSIRRVIKEKLKNGATHTEIALKLLNNEDVKVRINPRILTPDAVIARFVAERPELALKNKELLAEASRMNYCLDGSDHKAYAIWALVSSHLFYPEFSGVYFSSKTSIDDTKRDMDVLYAHMERVLKNEDGEYMEVIAKFTDFMARETANIRNLLDEEYERVSGLSSQPQKSLDMLQKKGCRAVVLNDEEQIDPFVLSIAANTGSEKAFIIVKKCGRKTKVSLRVVKGRLGANLYRMLNEEEERARGKKGLVDRWDGSELAGGSPLDGTAIKFDRIAMIVSKHI